MKILIVLEGERTEPNFFQSFLPKFDLNAELCVVGTNLYTLYHRCKLYNFECDVKDVLKELVKDESIIKLLDQNFAYTYLVFDADLHHKAPEQRNQSIPIEDLVNKNFSQLIEMAKHFSNETDPSIGRLYINYPMMESYRYCDDFYDSNYLSALVSVDEIRNFKQLASKMKQSGIPLEKYERNNFTNLIYMNVKKLKLLSSESIRAFPSYDEYQKISESKMIAENQYEKVKTEQQLYVLNTSLFIVLDYFGNKNGFYDTLTGTSKANM